MKSNKHIKQAKRRETLRMTHHIESLGAAFCRETGMLPSETALVTTNDDKGTYYYFTKKPEPLDVDGLPPAMRELFDLGAALNNAVAANDADGVKACHYGLAAFFAGLK